MLWKLEIEVEILKFSYRHINALTTENDNNTKWALTGFYGLPNTNKRKQMWVLMPFLKLLTINLGVWQEILMKFFHKMRKLGVDK